jgi:hypothetical protein
LFAICEIAALSTDLTRYHLGLPVNFTAIVARRTGEAFSVIFCRTYESPAVAFSMSFATLSSLLTRPLFPLAMNSLRNRFNVVFLAALSVFLQK